MSSSKDNFPEYLLKCLENIVKQEGYVSYNIKKEPLSTKGIGFLGKPFIVTIKGKTNDGEKQTNIFVKGIIPCEKLGEMVKVSSAYISESFVYNDLSVILSELQEEAGIPEIDRYKIIKSYGVSNSQGIFLENVAIKGFTVPPRLYKMTLQMAEMAFKEIAKFHALSFVIQKKRPEFYDVNIANRRIPFTFTDTWESSTLNIAQTAIQYLNDRTREKMEKILPGMVEKFRRYLLELPKYNCLCHGDFRIHNLLVKQKDDDIADLFVVDYQLLNTSSPINDLLFFLMLGTEKDFRKKHLEYLKKYYYDYFREFLAKFDLDSEHIYPRKEYEKDFTERLDYGLICAFFFLPLFMADEDYIPDITEESIIDIEMKMDKSFPKRLQDLVDDYIEWGCL